MSSTPIFECFWITARHKRRKIRAGSEWLVQANKHIHAREQWSHASVGLAQACPNYIMYTVGVRLYFSWLLWVMPGVASASSLTLYWSDHLVFVFSWMGHHTCSIEGVWLLVQQIALKTITTIIWNHKQERRLWYLCWNVLVHLPHLLSLRSSRARGLLH